MSALSPYGIRTRYKYTFRLPDGEIIQTDSFLNRLWRLRTNILSWVNFWNDERTKGFDCKMITLTYRGSKNWKPDHLTKFSAYVKRFLGTDLLTYAWVGELQERGEMHYHFLFYARSCGNFLPMPDKPNKKGFIAWSHGCTKIETARERSNYLASYGGKEDQKDFERYPSGARSFGIWVNKSSEYAKEFKQVKAYTNAPQLIKNAVKAHSAPESINYDYFARYQKTKGYLLTQDGERLQDLALDELLKYGIIRNQNGKLRALIDAQYIEHDYQKEPIKLKHAPAGYFERKGLLRIVGKWFFDGESIDSQIELNSINRVQSGLWVDELKEMTRKSIERRAQKSKQGGNST